MLWAQDEIEELDKAIEARHKAELEAWEAANEDEDGADATLVAPTAGLYDLKIGTDERQPKVRLDPVSSWQKAPLSCSC